MNVQSTLVKNLHFCVETRALVPPTTAIPVPLRQRRPGTSPFLIQCARAPPPPARLEPPQIHLQWQTASTRSQQLQRHQSQPHSPHVARQLLLTPFNSTPPPRHLVVLSSRPWKQGTPTCLEIRLPLSPSHTGESSHKHYLTLSH